MAVSQITQNLASVVAERRVPTITFWNRLEGRPRAEKFDRALKAEVRDALWMLTRQWQMGEFRGDDAGSPIFARIRLTTTRLRKYQADGHEVEPFDDTVPLEAEVERRPLPFARGGREISLDLRLLLGREWLKRMKKSGQFAGDYEAELIAKFPIHVPDPDDPRDAVYCAHPEAWAGFAAVAGRRMDGAKLYFHLKGNPPNPWDGLPSLVGREAQADALVAPFLAWFEKLFFQPEAQDAWVPDRLEYQFACSAPQKEGEKVFTAEEYFHGHLDWYNLDIDPGAATLGEPSPPDPELPKTHRQVLLPTPVAFDGMPNTRWWTFEDGRTNFGDVKPDTTDLAKLLLIEFGLVYANDWFLVPYNIPAGSVARIEGVAVTNVFGERTWVEAAGRGLDDDWQRWAMFLSNLKGQGRQIADTSLLLLPTAPKVQEGRPLEEVVLLRDEIANMVWGVEKTIPLPTGDAKPGREAARETRAWFGEPPAPPPPVPEAKIRYQVMSTVPENWIPFIPVHKEGDNREIQLQRAALPRFTAAPTSAGLRKIRPRTGLLRQGLDESAPYFLHEEEVPRAGVLVSQSFQRTRWRDGRAWVWLGVRKKTGRGEGSSGLAFDRIVDVPRKD